MIMSLSILDLSINETKIKCNKNYQTMEMKILSDEKNQSNIIFSLQLKECLKIEQLLINVSMHYFDADELTNKFIKLNEFEPLKIYGCRAILSNPIAISQSVEILYQIPIGSIPVNGQTQTQTKFITINSFGSKKIEFYFYFPMEGKFNHFPVHVTKDNKILGYGNKNELICKKQIKLTEKKIDINDWEDVSLFGSNSDVLNYLLKNNIFKTNLSLIYWRLNDIKDKPNEFFNNLTKLLRKNRLYDDKIWKYSIKFLNLKCINEYIYCTKNYYNNGNGIELIRKYLSPYYFSNWIVYNELKNEKYSHLEYFPLYNSRTYKLGMKKTINNEQFKEQYEIFLINSLFHSSSVNKLSNNILLESVYYLILQDRLNDANKIFKLIESQHLSNTIQYDYIDAYLNLCDDNDNQCVIAKNVSLKYAKNDKLPKHIKKLFNQLTNQLNEMKQLKVIECKEDNDIDIDIDIDDDIDVNMINEKDDIKEIDAILNFEIKNGNINFIYNCGVDKIIIKFYIFDIELLFSMSPFLDGLRDNNCHIFSYIEPNKTIELKLKSIE